MIGNVRALVTEIEEAKGTVVVTETAVATEISVIKNAAEDGIKMKNDTMNERMTTRLKKKGKFVDVFITYVYFYYNIMINENANCCNN